ncbi:MAG: hypothetical protein KDH97_23670, partial [Calditrichaeota bacterium]|nr:hypothetical protein [Calditrichota bacterium]
SRTIHRAAIEGAYPNTYFSFAPAGIAIFYTSVYFSITEITSLVCTCADASFKAPPIIHY